MPCYMTGSAEGDRALALEETRDRMLKRQQRLTRIMCATAKKARRDGFFGKLPDEFKRWARQHVRSDRK